MDFGLDRISRALSKLGLLEKAPFAVQVVGTNGKGSTVTFLERLFYEHGRTTGLYTSPHFVDVRERIAVNGNLLENTAWIEAANAVLSVSSENKSDRLTYFELLTVMAAWLFRQHRADTLVYEAGLGGTHDATSALSRNILAVAPVGLDHTAVLGDTIEAIAADKAGAVTAGMTLVTGRQEDSVIPILRQTALNNNAEILLAEDVLTHHETQGFPVQEILHTTPYRLPGAFQIRNAGLALATFLHACDTRGIEADPNAVRKALSESFIPGRMQLLGSNPQLLLDGAHNPHALRVLKEELKTRNQRPEALVYTALKDKDITSCVELVRDLTDGPIYVPALPGNERAFDADELARFIGPRAQACPNPEQALQAARDAAQLSVLICGSLYLVGAILEIEGWKPEKR